MAYLQHLANGQDVVSIPFAFFRVVFGGLLEFLDEVLMVFHAEVAHESFFAEKQMDPCEAVDMKKGGYRRHGF